MQGIALVVQCITKAYVFCSPKSRLSEDGLALVASEVLKDFYYLKLEDIQQAVLNGAKGNYGSNFSTIDGATLYKWLKQYEKDKEEDDHAKRQRRIQQYKDSGIDKTPIVDAKGNYLITPHKSIPDDMGASAKSQDNSTEGRGKE